MIFLYIFFFNDTATTEIYTLSLHDALPICDGQGVVLGQERDRDDLLHLAPAQVEGELGARHVGHDQDRKSTRLNSSHANISYAVFCLKKKKKKKTNPIAITIVQQQVEQYMQ